MREPEIDTLIEAAQAGQAEAFDRILTAYGPRLYGYLYRLIGSRQDAEDLLQDLFVRVVRGIGDYDHTGRFESWLFRIALNLVRDRQRHLRRRRGLLGAWGSGNGQGGEEVRAAEPVADEEPSAAMERAEDADQLQAALAALPPAEREVIMLRFFSDLTFQEIADVMGTPLGTALARGHRALRRLRGLLEEAGHER